jgi:hypothetical protein
MEVPVPSTHQVLQVGKAVKVHWQVPDGVARQSKHAQLGQAEDALYGGMHTPRERARGTCVRGHGAVHGKQDVHRQRNTTVPQPTDRGKHLQFVVFNPQDLKRGQHSELAKGASGGQGAHSVGGGGGDAGWTSSSAWPCTMGLHTHTHNVHPPRPGCE